VTDLADRTGRLYEPFLEWRLPHEPADGTNPYDVVATATFTHARTGAERTSPMFYDGEAWRFRFTGTALGEWRVSTAGPGGLDGHAARVTVEPNSADRKGFLTTDDTAWIWSATGEEHVPQLAMSKAVHAYWTGDDVDTDAIDEEVREFVTETGFTGFTKAGIGTNWFDVENESNDTRDVGPEPDPDAFAVLEAFLERAYRADASTHLWLWSSDLYATGGQTRGGPDGVGGPAGVAAYRLYRYIAARLGPIPGWSMGYGVDLGAWADAAELRAWYDFLKRHLHGWAHPLGGRADAHDDWDRECETDDGHRGRVFRGDLREGSDAVYWTGGDYVGLYNYRVPYQWYRATLAFADDVGRPVLQEDRFRIRDGKWFVKDYTPDLTRRGLWHAMMAGGVGNIWGNLLPDSDHRGSRPYDNGARGSIQDVEGFTVDVKDAIAAWRAFWFEEGRFRSDYRPANDLTDDEPGPTVWDTSPTGGHVGVALRDARNRHYVFYREEAAAVRMDLREMVGTRPAVAVDTRTGEREDLGRLEPRLHDPCELGSVSDWAVAVGEFDAPGGE